MAGDGLIGFERDSDFLVDGATCRYKVVFSKLATSYSTLHLTISRLRHADLFITSTTNFSSPSFTETIACEGDTIIAGYPNEVYVTVKATSIEDEGDF